MVKRSGRHLHLVAIVMVIFITVSFLGIHFPTGQYTAVPDTMAA